MAVTYPNLERVLNKVAEIKTLATFEMDTAHEIDNLLCIINEEFMYNPPTKNIQPVLYYSDKHTLSYEYLNTLDISHVPLIIVGQILKKKSPYLRGVIDKTSINFRTYIKNYGKFIPEMPPYMKKRSKGIKIYV